MPKSLKNYAKELLQIALPIIMGNISFMLIGVGDVIVAGRHSTDTFASISIANAIISCIFTFGIGLVAGISPLLSNYRGEGKSVKKYFYPSIRFAMVIAFVTMVMILAVVPFISKIGFEQRLVADIQNYMLITAFSVFGGYLHACLKEFLQAFEIVIFPNIVTFICVFLNLILNIIFVFGFGPIAPMGVIGLAISSFIVRYFMGFVLLTYCFVNMRLSNYHEKGYYKSLVKLGFPISMAILVEFVAFNGVAVLMGRVAGIYAAAQNLVCTLTTISFMIPFAISNAMAVKVGYSNGAENYADLKKYCIAGISMAEIFMLFSSLVFLTLPKQIVALFTPDIELYKIVLPIMFILAIFQLFDGLQISFAGICKGLKQTKIVLLANFVAYWLFALPIGYVFAFKYKMMLSGFWIGLFVSSIILCLIMYLRLFSKFRKMGIITK